MKRQLESYMCIRCEREHSPASYPVGKDGQRLSYQDCKTQALKAQFDAALHYEHHRKFAEGTEGAEAIQRIRQLVHKGDTVYTILRHVSSSGMSRRISVVRLCCEKGTAEPRDITCAVGRVLGLKMGDKEGLVVGGCGMDMGFHVVYEMASVVFGDGYAVKQRWL